MRRASRCRWARRECTSSSSRCRRSSPAESRSKTPRVNEGDPPAADDTKFQLYNDKATADAAFFSQTLPYVAYFDTSIQGLSKGSPVQLYGVQVGSVTDVKLVYDSEKKHMTARVGFELQPERVMNNSQANNVAVPTVLLHAFLESGMKVSLESASMLTGSKDLALVYDHQDQSGQAAEGRQRDRAARVRWRFGQFDSAAVGRRDQG